MDCDKGNNGYNGKLLKPATEYKVKNHGLTSESNYSYIGEDNLRKDRYPWSFK